MSPRNLIQLSRKRGGDAPRPDDGGDGGAPDKAAGGVQAGEGPEIRLTAAAAAEIRRQAERRGTPDAAIRLGIRGGGCSGFSYLFDWQTGDPRPRDKVFEEQGVRLYVDPKSLALLAGTVLDFETGISGHGFKFLNPNVKSTCGCGESVQF